MQWLNQAVRRLVQAKSIYSKAEQAKSPVQAVCDIADFTPEDDALICIWDDSTTQAAPEVRILRDEQQAGWLRICLGGRTVARVSGLPALTAPEVSVIPLSSARALGLPLQ